jgi:hypothetical protein
VGSGLNLSPTPTCPAASHAKDNSNSPLGLSQGPQPSMARRASFPLCIQRTLCLPRTPLAQSSLEEEAPVSKKLRGKAQSFKIPKMFTALGAELQGSGLTSGNQRVRQASLTATPSQAC